MKKTALLVAAVAGLASTASAQFTYGSFGITGIADNLWGSVNLGGATPGSYASFTVTFDWTDDSPAFSSFSEGWANEARLQFGSGSVVAAAVTTPTYNFGASQSAVTSSNGAGNGMAQPGVMFNGAFNSAYDGSGDLWFNYRQTFNGNNVIDWNSISVTLNPLMTPTATDLGCYDAGDFAIDTEGSAFDTELGLYDSAGNLLANDDDGGTGALSLINANLAEGTYYIALGAFNTTYGDAFGASSTSNLTGDFLLNINGSNVAGGVLAASTVNWYSIKVIPTPASASMLALGGLVATRRRR